MEIKWLEILGCGMVHPNVFAKVGIQKTEMKGFAFGWVLSVLQC